jgi:undecaprenyl-diphosphatase
MIEIIILSLVQGVTEFLPISSSSHLIIISNYLNLENQSLVVDVSLHIGSFIAVVVYFKKDIFNFIKNKEFLFKILISSIPVL